VHVADRLVEAVRAAGSVACVGLDPRPGLVPPVLRDEALAVYGDTAVGVAAAFVRYNAGIIDAVAGRCACVKLQSACYEAYGAAGWQAMEDTVAIARDAEVVVIVDAKRGDMGASTTHYRQAFFGGAPGLRETTPVMPGAGADWLTASPYQGSDTILELLGEPGDHGVFVLASTSNPSSDEVQGAVLDRVATLVERWGRDRLGGAGFSDVGAVVGANRAEDARRLRQAMPTTFFLVPGYGTQGADPLDALAGARPDGSGVVVNNSRQLLGAWQAGDPAQWQAAVADALTAMNEALPVA
jgi:orotidine-5'-phosphate decarboxylase